MHATITVDTLTDEADGSIDDGDVSLRDAIALAATGDAVEFASALEGGTIVLSQGELRITRSMTINAIMLMRGLTIDASGNDSTPNENYGDGSRIFNIDDGDSFTDSPVTLQGLTLTGGDIRTYGGGAVLSRERLIIENSTISGNSAAFYGGGIYASGAVTVVNTTIADNTGPYFGGGLAALGTIDVTRSTISRNVTIAPFGGWGGGGGIYTASEVAVTESSIVGNSTDAGGFGGGINAADVTIVRSTITGNFGGVGGGVSSGRVSVSNSTVSGNSAHKYGGGIRAAHVNVTNSTISGNAASGGGGILIPYSIDFESNSLTMDHSIVAGNTGADVNSMNANNVDIQFSLIGDNTTSGFAEAPLGSPDENGNLIGDTNGQGIIDPLLGRLAYNGGPTSTHALLPGSPAINMGDPDFNVPPDFDQRGGPFNRNIGGRIDIGAFEYQTEPVDFVADGLLTCEDMNALAAAISGGNGSTTFDLTGDAIVNSSDLDVWLTLAGLENLQSHTPYLRGDANLDGSVDAEDFGIWDDHRFTETAAWCEADFNADGVTDVSDFDIWNENKFTSGLVEPMAYVDNRLPRAPLDQSVIRTAIPSLALRAVDSLFASSAQPSDRSLNVGESATGAMETPHPQAGRLRTDAIFRRLGRSPMANGGTSQPLLEDLLD
ncbi:MAG: right-handed parallel beta-helix repeat-containing protein [Planctomycetales bacterium]|nr:right-handed parallel beta-helix repeat-containing protein [Planctomycetales bacterium]